ncbi:MAG: nitroreductase family protein [Oscillospiraceae bacterium]|nr:nitroreductase family protein [Oscillospiraceae bacterium]MBQ7013698.1 nitroreductase family protein [Oscillospiraceae bacterium]
MEFLELAKKRCSTRKYTTQKVEQEKLDAILEAARVAPTGKNAQAFKLLVIQSEEGLNKLKEAANFYDAPLAVLICADIEETWHRSFDGKIISDIDASIVSTHMVLEATDLGLASLWICRFKPDVVREAFSIPEGLEPVNLTVFGYPADELKSPDRHAADRKALDALVVNESF